MFTFPNFVFGNILLSLKSHYVVSVVAAEYVPCAKVCMIQQDMKNDMN